MISLLDAATIGSLSTAIVGLASWAAYMFATRYTDREIQRAKRDVHREIEPKLECNRGEP